MKSCTETEHIYDVLFERPNHISYSFEKGEDVNRTELDKYLEFFDSQNWGQPKSSRIGANKINSCQK